MRKFTLFLASLFLTLGAMAQTNRYTRIADFEAGRTNSKVYTLKTTRSPLYFNTTQNELASYWTSSSMSTQGDRADAASAEQQFAFLRTDKTDDGKYYMYSVNGNCFVDIKGIKSETPVAVAYFINVTDKDDSNHHGLKLCLGETGDNVVNVTWWSNNNAGGLRYNTNTEADAGNVYELIAYDQDVDLSAPLAKIELGEAIQQVLAYYDTLPLGNGVGQYSSSIEGVDEEFARIYGYYNSIVDSTPVEEIEAKTARIAEIIASYSPNMPINGKAYTFKNVQKDGTTVCWFKYDNGSIGLTTNKDEATAFICRKLDNGEYAFVMNAGKYMIWKGSDGGYNSNNGVSDSYDNTDVRMADFTIEKMTTGNNISGDLSYTTRYVQVKGRRATGNDRINYYVIKRNNGNPIFDQANAPFYNDNFSSAFIMDEVEYANKPNLNSVGTSSLLTEDLHNKAMATFSAPFATVVPAGVTAYYATAGNGYVTLNAIDNTKAVPANTGVILVGENAGEAIMAPAAGEAVAAVDGNVLAHSAGAAIDITDGYILAAKDGVAGFYKATAGTLAMNKAYIAINGTQGAVEVRLPGTTGVEEVKTESGNVKTIYDLTGRRVEAITAPGIYIINGKKTLVK
ncbi:MAG: hypothetical protein IKY73_06020 [Bacteroidaceae bacterium]|nr:hypothetical protein [Bacteroidaceae bacterium]